MKIDEKEFAKLYADFHEVKLAHEETEKRVRKLEKSAGVEPLDEEDLAQEDIIKISLTSAIQAVLHGQNIVELSKRGDALDKLLESAVSVAAKTYNTIRKMSKTKGK